MKKNPNPKKACFYYLPIFLILSISKSVTSANKKNTAFLGLFIFKVNYE